MDRKMVKLAKALAAETEDPCLISSWTHIRKRER